jgi:hypothetical protein
MVQRGQIVFEDFCISIDVRPCMVFAEVFRAKNPLNTVTGWCFVGIRVLQTLLKTND